MIAQLISIKQTLRVVLVFLVVALSSVSGSADAISAEIYLNIDQTHDAILGCSELTCLRVDSSFTEFSSFDVTVSFDAQRLGVISVNQGDVFDGSGWEYFNYYLISDSSCVDCPTGMVRIVGQAGAGVLPERGSTLACLEFQGTVQGFNECASVDVDWLWLDCYDNTLQETSGAFLLSERVSKEPSVYGEEDITGVDNVLPTITGAPVTCDTALPVTSTPAIDFTTGGISFVCADSVSHPRGDVNINGHRCESSDAVMFINYFLYGLSAFGDYVDAAINATGMNGDGNPLTPSDLTALIHCLRNDFCRASTRKITSGAPAQITIDEGWVISVDQELGSALFVFEGETDPTLLAPGLSMQYNLLEGETRVLVYSLEGLAIPQGAVLSVDAPLVEVQLSDPNGQMLNAVISREQPDDFFVTSNYPNPFNPTTVISFSLPTKREYIVTVYNLVGQRVFEQSGVGESGENSVRWDASEFPSGLYLGRIQAGVITSETKMLLLK